MRVWTVHAPPEAPPEAAPGIAAPPLAAAASVPASPVPATTPEGRASPRPPVLLREAAFCWLAFFFAGLWFLWHRMWIVFAIYLALAVLLGMLLPERIAPWAAFALQLLVGFSARDLRRWTLERRGWRLAAVVAAPDEDAAWARLFTERPEFARAGLARLAAA